jgi:hypothetical protein
MNEQIEESQNIQNSNNMIHIVNDIVNIFKLYPNVFPGGYFRFLKAKIIKKIEKNEIIFEDGVVLTWTKYKRKTKLTPNISILKDDIKINQLVNRHQGNGLAKKIFSTFINNHCDTTMYLDVKADNKRAIQFYKKNKFIIVGEKTFGKNIRGLIMKRHI